MKNLRKHYKFYFFTLRSESCFHFSLFTSRGCQLKKKENNNSQKKKHLAGVFWTELTGKLTISFTIVFAGAVALLTKNFFFLNSIYLIDWSRI